MPNDPRAPLSQPELEAALARLDVSLTLVRVLPETGSTNADAVELVRTQSGPLLVTTDLQVSGRGRLDRRWETPPGAAVLMSVALRPGVPPSAWGWLPLLAGVAVVQALRGLVPGALAERLRLKWPNDVMVVDPATGTLLKLAGILAERAAGDHAVIGIGLNVDQTADELPIAAATSLAAAGARVQRPELIAAIAERLVDLTGRLAAAAGDAERCGLADDYRAVCATPGQRVEVRLPGGAGPHGVATAITSSGELVVDTADGLRTVSAGDVVHVMPRT